jgi:hypothetical protein
VGVVVYTGCCEVYFQTLSERGALTQWIVYFLGGARGNCHYRQAVTAWARIARKRAMSGANYCICAKEQITAQC